MDLQRLHEIGKWISCVSTGGFTLSNKKLLCCSTVFHKIVSSLQQRQKSLGILDSPYWKNSSNGEQELNHSDFYSLEQEVSSLSSYLLPTHKKKIILTLLIHNIPHSYWRNTLFYNIYHRVDIYKLVKRQASSFC